jgi:hypothetical protein
MKRVHFVGSHYMRCVTVHGAENVKRNCLQVFPAEQLLRTSPNDRINKSMTEFSPHWVFVARNQFISINFINSLVFVTRKGAFSVRHEVNL